LNAAGAGSLVAKATAEPAARRVFALYSNLEATATAFVALFSCIVHFEKQLLPNDRHDWSGHRHRLRRLSLSGSLRTQRNNFFKN